MSFPLGCPTGLVYRLVLRDWVLREGMCEHCCFDRHNCKPCQNAVLAMCTIGNSVIFLYVLLMFFRARDDVNKYVLCVEDLNKLLCNIAITLYAVFLFCVVFVWHRNTSSESIPLYVPLYRTQTFFSLSLSISPSLRPSLFPTLFPSSPVQNYSGFGLPQSLESNSLST